MNNHPTEYKRKQKTEVKKVTFQVGFFLEPIYHHYYIEVPVVKKRKK